MFLHRAKRWQPIEARYGRLPSQFPPHHLAPITTTDGALIPRTGWSRSTSTRLNALLSGSAPNAALIARYTNAASSMPASCPVREAEAEGFTPTLAALCLAPSLTCLAKARDRFPMLGRVEVCGEGTGNVEETCGDAFVAAGIEFHRWETFWGVRHYDF